MAVTRPKTQPIQINVKKGQIELGERYACSLDLHAQIEWRCDHPFAVRFDWDAPFTLHPNGNQRMTLRFKAGAALMPNHPYPYTIAVYAEKKVITGIAIIIVKPPRPLPLPTPGGRFLSILPGVIIVKPPKP